ncbi:MAG TPA: hypothetical protein VFQ85_17105 [Mycobacteriales bacterium]|jgi:hypothetical protein|nr:hypothetical protein [Mycobacteriales bacterium]
MRLASQAPFPYVRPGRVCYIEQTGEQVVQITTIGDLREAVGRARAGGSRLLAVWPGEWRSDLFLIDDLDALAANIG